MKSQKESVEQFMARGGKIQQLPAYAPIRRTRRTRTHTANMEAAVRELYRGNFLDALALAESN